MAEFNKDDYLKDLPDPDDARDTAASSAPADTPADAAAAKQSAPSDESAKTSAPSSAESAQTSAPSDEGAGAANAATEGETSGKTDAAGKDSDNTLTPLGQAKKEAADYLEALQRERAEFINYRNRAKKEQERFRQHGIIDVLTALLPALDDIDRIRANSEMDDSFKAVAAKIDKAFEKFGVEKFGEAGEDFDPTKHDAILHKPDASAEKETVDTVVEAGYRIGDRVIRAARVVVSSPQN
ncbi:nucleotide exchange factor GrpE [Bifidobacterium callitrichos]|uniref:Protein GrpE n=1 Tax=Bifidobacterium callitrichos TaxID=762209 RepID=A0A5M9ZAH5_9BIFI|nr:nucleotide exchange factor GrpE [Bifidobacterium callitrichos]KAA8815385.1 nucleotide exchange factor GrpE [Bifidobacterium callitrichos]